jgi:multisubunit Na+/H+ antiporter MnhB subunit
MIKKRFIIIGIISLLITLSSPYLFKGYFEKKPHQLTQNVHFGGPIPFVNQEVVLPGKESSYPLEVDFQSPFEEKTHINLISFFFSLIIFFTILFSLYSLIIYFFRKNDRYEK